MRNENGLAPIIIIAIIALLGASVAGGIYYSSQKSNSSGGIFQQKIKLNEKEQADYDKATLANQEIATLIEHAQGAGLDSEALENLTDQVVEQKRQEVSEKAKALTSKNPCDARMIDIQEALELAEQAWKLTDEVTGDLLWNWAREAFRAFVVDAAMAVGATFLERDIDLFSLSYEERKVLYAQTRETFYDRALLAQQAQLFGFDDLHRKIMAGETLEPVCIQLWDVSTEVEYYSSDGESFAEHWTVGATVKDVPIYKAHPKLDLQAFQRQASEKGYIKIHESWWKEAPDAETYYPEYRGNAYWQIKMDYKEDVNDFWNDEIHITSEIDQWQTTYTDNQEPEVRSPGYDDEWGPWREIWYFDEIEMNIPVLLFWQREPFSHEESEVTDEVLGEKVTKRVDFIPTKRVKVEDLNY